jgi:MoaA/NifB/PqqE/SkfB family radical SAM enzyme
MFQRFAVGAMSKSFCIIPFRHQMIEPSGLVKLCCMAEGYVEKSGNWASIYQHTLNDIWRSEYMRDIRQQMLNSEPVAVCKRCYDFEKSGGSSYRMLSNGQYHGADGAELSETSFDTRDLDGDLVDGGPDFFQLVLGNFCNLKCRMCSATYSSAIESDPVHSAWAPHHDILPPVWRKNSVSIGPQAKLGVALHGFGDAEPGQGQIVRWTTGEASLSLAWLDSYKVASLEIDIADEPGRDRQAKIEVNGVARTFVVADSGKATIEFDISDIAIGKELSIAIRSNSSPGGPALDRPGAVEFLITMSPSHDRPQLEVRSGGHPASARRGLPISDIRLIRRPERFARQRTVLSSRFSGDGAWYEQTSVLFAEILRAPDRLRKLQITGGEPLALPQTERLFEHLIDVGAARNITLALSTNCTFASNALLDKLGQFGRVELNMSIEGVDVDQEYIRFPSKWEEIASNVQKFQRVPGISLSVTPTVQVYNFLRMDKLLMWCDEIGVYFYPQMLFDPNFISLAVAPRAAKLEAIERVKQALGRIRRPETTSFVEALFGMLAADIDKPLDPQLVATFMRFTNELDQSREQRFADSHAELLEFFRASGYTWQH